ncbi:MAG: alpha/beta hydrolase [Verrucomicrobiae bacterium]|nr:alpha/beta hydrolase [Verrucomicrobiae bacterium]
MSDFVIKVNFPECSPTLVYLPGIHGDSTLAQKIRRHFENKTCFVEIEYSKRTDLKLTDYARSIENLLIKNEIKECWLLAESFGSQVAWAIVSEKRAFKVKGIILAGGFVRHPFIPGVRVVKTISKVLSIRLIELWLKFYVAVCRIFFRKKKTKNQPSLEQPVPEQFVKNRLDDADRLAIISRYDLIIRNDFRPTACNSSIPVYFISGKWDFIVPWQPVLKWLKKNCPGFKDYKILPNADHPVLSVAPENSAHQILSWIKKDD